jgi:serine/threonine-protein kinase
MPRPDTVQDVIDLVRRSRVVDDARLTGFLEPFGGAAARPVCDLTPAAVLEQLVGDGLLTRFQADELAAGRTGFWVGGYRILDRLGAGGMGQVFLAEHAMLQKRVAVKVLSIALRDDETARERFVREARAAAAVNHPNIVQVFDVDASHDPPFLVMEYVDGVSLPAAVARFGTFAPGEAAAVGTQVALGLREAAAVGLVHRDIKPANVLADRRGGVKILDLGIARLEGDPISRRVNTAVVLGTLDYLAPEQAEDSSEVDTRADLYGLGATLYFLLAGHPPYPDEDLGRKMALKQSADPTPIHFLRPDVPVPLSAVLSRLLARDPDGRYPTPAEAADALEPWAAPGPDFPTRLFRPWQPDTVEQSDRGTDSDATPVPPTRRILHTHTRRPTAPPPATPPPTAPLVIDATPPGLPPAGPTPDEQGSPTANLLPVAEEIRGGRFGGMSWRVGAAVVLAALLAAAAAWAY